MHYFRKGIHMITEKDMQYVLTIANYGNLTKAANALFLSQPALSIHLKQLETSLGIQLLKERPPHDSYICRRGIREICQRYYYEML